MSLNYVFTGSVGINAIESKNPPVREGSTKDGKNYKTFSCSVASSKNNRAFIEMFGMEPSGNLKFKDADKNDIEIAADDRFDEDVMNKVASYYKRTVNITERKDFLTDWDAVNELINNIDELKDKTITVTGQVNKNIYNGNITDRFQIQKMYIANEDTPNKLLIKGDFYWDIDGVDIADWKSEKIITINGYIKSYVSENRREMFIPQTAVFDASKIDFNNEKHIKLLSYKLKQLGIELDGDKIKCKLKSGKIYKLGITFSYINGSQEVDFDESTLTQNQKEAIALGLKSIDDFRPAGSIYGERITRYQIIDFDLRNEGENGAYDSGIIPSEFEEDIYRISKPESVDDLDEFAQADDDEEDLFG